MEACGGSNYWGRELQKRGYEVKLIVPQHVKPFVNLPAAGRAQAVGGRTRLVNQIRGLLQEYGMVACLQQAGHYAANLGLVPREHSSGGRQRLGGITKRGNRYLRRLLVQGAWSVLRYADRSEDRLSRWARQVTCLLQAGGSHRQA